jgi:hypothetical protein
LRARIQIDQKARLKLRTDDSRLRTPMQPRAAIVASDAMKRTTIAISKKVNVPRVNTFKAAAIAT